MEEEQKEEYLSNETISVRLPQCCVEGLDSCPHVAKEQKEKKVNVGL